MKFLGLFASLMVLSDIVEQLIALPMEAGGMAHHIKKIKNTDSFGTGDILKTDLSASQKLDNTQALDGITKGLQSVGSGKKPKSSLEDDSPKALREKTFGTNTNTVIRKPWCYYRYMESFVKPLRIPRKNFVNGKVKKKKDLQKNIGQVKITHQADSDADKNSGRKFIEKIEGNLGSIPKVHKNEKILDKKISSKSQSETEIVERHNPVELFRTESRERPLIPQHSYRSSCIPLPGQNFNPQNQAGHTKLFVENSDGLSRGIVETERRPIVIEQQLEPFVALERTLTTVQRKWAPEALEKLTAEVSEASDVENEVDVGWLAFDRLANELLEDLNELRQLHKDLERVQTNVESPAPDVVRMQATKELLKNEFTQVTSKLQDIQTYLLGAKDLNRLRGMQTKLRNHKSQLSTMSVDELTALIQEISTLRENLVLCVRPNHLETLDPRMKEQGDQIDCIWKDVDQSSREVLKEAEKKKFIKQQVNTIAELETAFRMVQTKWTPAIFEKLMSSEATTTSTEVNGGAEGLRASDSQEKKISHDLNDLRQLESHLERVKTKLDSKAPDFLQISARKDLLKKPLTQFIGKLQDLETYSLCVKDLGRIQETEIMLNMLRQYNSQIATISMDGLTALVREPSTLYKSLGQGVHPNDPETQDFRLKQKREELHRLQGKVQQLARGTVKKEVERRFTKEQLGTIGQLKRTLTTGQNTWTSQYFEKMMPADALEVSTYQNEEAVGSSSINA
ncbi:hypothetical protein CROQUDRAFT_133374 [Cronartium quercuum f. sp. fusiforme G11]|uniref:Uncharacterized protein n=1 Tax=Cronartium quercuum f. sp. fusiforme G11 TaxID=708437 RepID=A0A9P6NFL6_9BASI|nr:hypothetical protein CROQUDRAFT_133374 [Cronartium quercuum f. sp. fusiforme G11]